MPCSPFVAWCIGESHLADGNKISIPIQINRNTGGVYTTEQWICTLLVQFQIPEGRLVASEEATLREG